MSMLTNQGKKKSKNAKAKFDGKCNSCNKQGHKEDQCWIKHPELKLEFLSPERGKGGLDSRQIRSLGLRAISIRFMDMLLKDSIFMNEENVRVRVHTLIRWLHFPLPDHLPGKYHLLFHKR